MERSDAMNDREVFEAAAAANLGQVLLKCARLLNEQALARIRARTGMQIRPAHTTVFPHIDLEGTRLTEIASRLGVSKQAAGQLVSELVEMGALERIPDPSDGRAKLVRFPVRDGTLSVFAGLAVLGEFEAELAERAGPERVESLRAGLRALLEMLTDAETDSTSPSTSTSPSA